MRAYDVYLVGADPSAVGASLMYRGDRLPDSGDDIPVAPKDGAGVVVQMRVIAVDRDRLVITVQTVDATETAP